MHQRAGPASATPRSRALPVPPRWASWLPAAFVSIYLALLGLVFLWLGRRIEERQAVSEELIRPARDRLVELQRALALGIAATGAYAARPDSAFAELFSTSEARIAALERELAGFAHRLGGDVEREMARFLAARESWAAVPRSLIAGRISLAAFRSRLVAQHEVIREVTAASARLEAAIDAHSARLMAQLRDIEALRRGLVGAAVLLALLAAILAAVYGERNRRLTAALAKRRIALLRRERAGREELAKLLESIADAFYALDDERRLTYVNRQAEELCGSRREELLGRRVEEVFPAAMGTEAERALDHALRRREAAPFETATPVAGRWLEGVAYPARDGGATILLRDVSDRKRAALERARLAAAVESKRRLLEAVVKQMPAGVIIAEAPSGRIILGNPQIDRIWRARLSGARHLGQYRSWMLEHADGRPYTWDELPLVRALVAGDIVEAEAIDIRRGDGSRGTIRASAAPVRDERGEIVAGVATFYDITQQRRLEQGLRLLGEAGRMFASSLDYRHTLKAVVRLAVPRFADWCGVHLVRPDGRGTEPIETAYADPARGPLFDELVRRFPLGLQAMQPIAEVIRTGTPQFTPEVDADVLARAVGEPAVRELVQRLGVRSGMVLPLRAGGRVVGALALAYAESGRRYDRYDFDLAQELARRASMAVHNAHLYRETQDALRARDEVLAIVSHDLRNPLHTIGMTVEVLLEVRPPPEQQAQHLEAVLRATRQMDRLIQDLLDVSRIQAGKPLRIEPAPRSPARLVTAAAEAFRAAAGEKHVRLEVAAREDLPPAYADEGRILQVLANLLSNALKFTPSGGVVRVGAEALRDGVRFYVQDTGPGIAPQDLERIFQPFWQVRRTARLGTGLGLGIARGIVEQHGGHIWAESEPGAGSTFSFTLPFARPDSMRAA